MTAATTGTNASFVGLNLGSTDLLGLFQHSLFCLFLLRLEAKQLKLATTKNPQIFRQDRLTAYFTHGFEHFLLVRFHVSECSNLSKIHILSVAKSDDLIESKQQFEGMIVDLLLLNCLAVLRNLVITIKIGQRRQFFSWRTRTKL